MTRETADNTGEIIDDDYRYGAWHPFKEHDPKSIQDAIAFVADAFADHIVQHGKPAKVEWIVHFLEIDPDDPLACVCPPRATVAWKIYK